MGKISKVLSASVLTAALALPLAAHAATSVADGNLTFDGGQTSTHVYSEIWETKKGAGKYNVQAIVKVGGATYKSKFQPERAYKSKERVWYANETSGYDYERR